MGHGKCLLKVFELLKVVEDLVCQPILCRDGSNSNVGIVLSPHNGRLMEVVDLRNEEGNILLILRDTVLGAESTTRPYMSLGLRRSTHLLAVILGKKLGVDVTEEKKRGR